MPALPSCRQGYDRKYLAHNTTASRFFHSDSVFGHTGKVNRQVARRQTIIDSAYPDGNDN